MTLVMLSNGIDLSVGSLMSLCGMVAGISLSKGLGLIPALFSGILIGLASGLLHRIPCRTAGVFPFYRNLWNDGCL